MKVAIFGASGFSREVADICWASGIKKMVFVDKVSRPQKYYGIPTVDESVVYKLSDQGYKFVIGIGNNRIRKMIYEKYNRLPYINVIHPSATFGLGQREKMIECMGNIIASGVRFTNQINISNFGVFNLNSTIGHDCVIEDFVNICPGVNISGNVIIGEGSFIGTNACIIQGSIDKPIIVGKNSVIGAGAVVIDDVQVGLTVAGIPAKAVKHKQLFK